MHPSCLDTWHGREGGRIRKALSVPHADHYNHADSNTDCPIWPVRTAFLRTAAVPVIVDLVTATTKMTEPQQFQCSRMTRTRSAHAARDTVISAGIAINNDLMMSTSKPSFFTAAITVGA